jgi:hypothetical protein
MEPSSAPQRSIGALSSFDPASTLPAGGDAPSKAADDLIEEKAVVVVKANEGEG